jgi:serine/threonine protein kinase
MEKYNKLEQLGNGAYGVVYKALELRTGEYVAIKKLKKKYTNWDECVNLREVKSLNNLSHKNIVKLKELIKTDDAVSIVFEYMNKNLYEEMQNRIKRFHEDEIRNMIYQTLEGLAYMHKYGFFHRDLKPENLLIKDSVIKIADFGLAREIRSLPPYTDYVSTRWYRAPECVLRSTNYNSPIDIWAVGVIMVELYNNKPLFPGTNDKDMLFKMSTVLGSPLYWAEGLQMVKKLDFKFPLSYNNSLKQVVQDASDPAIDIIGQMLKWDPNQRTTAQNLLQHPYFFKITKGTALNSVPTNKYYDNIVFTENSISKDFTPDLSKSKYYSNTQSSRI